MLCIKCGEETTNIKFCSQPCAIAHLNETRIRKKKVWECVVCGEPSERRRKYCKRHKRTLDITIEEAEERYFKHHRSSVYALIRTRARAENTGTTCQICGYDKHVEVSHIQPISSFPKDTLISVINRKDNILVLCPNCHWEFDNGLI